ncbi:cell division protein ZipA-like [Schistocerca serialis cubense]|uniref:cell division protein ZipA-like n=1 Tax=Schistocerca serialis cubense TaxID=2023355 RepID=UPI00214ED21B|nr:cell division protein ZipA-like [Schistocerca serialis cubense]
MDIHVLQSQPAQKVAFKDSSTVRVDLVRGGFQPRLPTSLPPPGQQQQPSPLRRRQPVPLMPPAQLHPGAPQVVAPAPAVPLQSPPPSELMDVDPSAGPPSQAVAVQPVLQPLSLGTPKDAENETLNEIKKLQEDATEVKGVLFMNVEEQIQAMKSARKFVESMIDEIEQQFDEKAKLI